MEGCLFVTDNQRSWMKTQLIMRRLKPTRRRNPPADPVGTWCFRLVYRAWFDPMVMVLIVLNTVVMAMEYFGQSSTYTRCGPLLVFWRGVITTRRLVHGVPTKLGVCS